MGMTIPEEYGGGGHRHALVRDRGRGADAHRLVGRDHGRRAPLARHAADLPFGNEEQKRRVAARARLRPQARGVRPDRAGRGLGRRRDAHDRRARGRRVDRQRLEDVHHERRDGHHRLRDDHGAHRRGRDLEHRRPERHARLRDLGADAEARLARVRHARAVVPRRAPCRRRTCSGRAARGSGSSSDPRRRPDLGRGDGRRPRAGRLRPRARPTRRSGSSSGSRSPRSRRCSSRSPTWRPRSRPAGTLVYKAAWLKDQGRDVRAAGRDGEALHRRALEPRGERGAADPRRLRLHGRVRDLAPLPRPEDPRDRRGHERGAAHGDREAPRVSSG